MLTDELKDYLKMISDNVQYADEISLRAHLSGTGWTKDEINRAVEYVKSLPVKSEIQKKAEAHSKIKEIIDVSGGEVNFPKTPTDPLGIKIIKIVGSILAVPTIVYGIIFFVMPAVDTREVVQTRVLANNTSLLKKGIFETVNKDISGAVSLYRFGEEYAIEVENFNVTYGINLHMYLSPTPTLDNSDVIDFGKIPGHKGRFNFILGGDYDFKKINFIIIHDDMFDTIYGIAMLK